MERDGFIKNSDMKNKLLIIALWGLTAAVAMILIGQIIEEYVEYNEKEVLQMLVQGIVFVLSVVSLGVYMFFLFGRTISSLCLSYHQNNRICTACMDNFRRVKEIISKL